MGTEKKVLVVGTTSDYIDWIRTACPGSVVFLTDESARSKASEPVPHPGEELLCHLAETETVLQLLRDFLLHWEIELEGIACFDCEYLLLTSIVAAELGLDYPSSQAVENCRDKYTCKVLWKERGIDCPDHRVIHSVEEAATFIAQHDGPCVLKPVSGSGSELTFRCHSKSDCKQAVSLFRERKPGGYDDGAPVAGNTTKILAESWIRGKEYSCDFLIHEGRAEIIRFTAKISAPSAPFGTTLGYQLASPPPEIASSAFTDKLSRAAEALGIRRAICMVDFIVGDRGVFFLEMTPRIGGDCLPHLIRRIYGVDMLKLAVDYSRGLMPDRSLVDDRSHGIGLRVFAHKNGILQSIDTSKLDGNPRIKEIHFTKKAGHRISLPPEDYESWLLGYIIFIPLVGVDIDFQCNEILDRIHMEIS